MNNQETTTSNYYNTPLSSQGKEVGSASDSSYSTSPTAISLPKGGGY